MFCCFCDDSAVDDRPGAPLCEACWQRCEQKSRETKSPFAIAEDALTREAQRLATDPRSAGFLGVAAIGGAPKGTTTH
jgi:hypothetical protein